MSNMQLPAHLARRQSRGLAEAAVSGLGGNSPPHISIRQNRFWLVDGAGNERAAPNPLQLDVVIVDINHNVSKVYYEAAYDPTSQEKVPPTCFSDNGVGPSAQAMSPQSKFCSNCPQNVWGSEVNKVTGKRTKACNDAKKLAVVLPGGERMAFLLRVPPATLKYIRIYAQSVAGMAVNGREVELDEIITRVGFDPKTQGVLSFTPVGWIDEPTAVLIDEIVAAKATDAIVGRNDVPRGDALPPPQPAPQIAAPAPQRQFTPPETTQAPLGVQQGGLGSQFYPSSPGHNQADGRPQFGEQLAADEPAKRKRRTKAEMAADAAREGQVSDDGDEIPPFLRRAQPQPETENPAPPTAQFGMEEPEDADADLAAAIDRAMKLPT